MLRRLAVLLAGSGLLVLGLAATADASTSVIARLGTGHGAARLTSGGPNTIYVNASALARGTWTEVLYQGTCSQLSTRIVTLPVLTVGTSGAIARTNTITSSQARLARAGVIRLTHGSTAVCGSFAASPVVTASPTRKPSPSPSASRSPSPSPSRSPSPSPSTSASPSPTASASHGPDPSAGTILLDVSGRGSSTTQSVSVPANWEIDYLFDCSVQGQVGSFSITVNRGNGVSDTPVSTVSLGDGGSVVQTNRRGSVTLQIASSCDWEVILVAD